jgi:hypothetical protein
MQPGLAPRSYVLPVTRCVIQQARKAVTVGGNRHPPTVTATARLRFETDEGCWAVSFRASDMAPFLIHGQHRGESGHRTTTQANNK